MSASSRAEVLESLRSKIAALEAHPLHLTAEQAASDLEAPSLIPGGEPGLLHEVWADRHVHAAQALGFTLGHARGLLSDQRVALFWLQVAHEAQETGLPYAEGFGAFGIDPQRFLIARLHDIKDLLWAVEEVSACGAVAAVIADIGVHRKALDFTATRRLNLRAQEMGSSIFLMRYGTARETTAAHYRWRISPHQSAAEPYDARAPGAARWQVNLEKMPQALAAGAKRRETDWLLRWTDHGFARDGDVTHARPGAEAGASLYRAQSAALADGFSETA